LVRRGGEGGRRSMAEYLGICGCTNW